MEIEGATVTLDAMDYRTLIVSEIIEESGDYVIGLKRNHPNLHELVERYIATAPLVEQF
jgi:hypothetical protein